MAELGSQWGAVRIARDDDGGVTIMPDGIDPEILAGPVDPGEFGSVPVVGGVLLFEVEDALARPPRALVTGPDWAQCWVAGVFGPDVAVALEKFEDPEEYGPVSVEARHGYLSEVVSRLAVGFWLHRFWPAGSRDVPTLDVWLLELELGALAWLGEACFVDTTGIASLLEPHTEALVSHIEGLRAHGIGSADEQALEIMSIALRATVDVVSDEVPGYADCVRLLELIESDEVAFAESRGDPAWVDLLAAASLPAPLAARAARSGATTTKPLVTLEGTVDWLQVPARVVLGQVNNVRAQVLEGPEAGKRISVEVAAQPYLMEAPPEFLQVRVFGGGLPQAFVLEFDPARRAFVGERPLRADINTDVLAIDVFAAEYVQRPRLDRDVVVAFIRRVVAQIRARLDAAAPTVSLLGAEVVAKARDKQ